MSSALEAFGWTDDLARAFAAVAPAGCAPARVVGVHRGLYALQGATESLTGRLPGRSRQRVAEPAELPVVGDWVAWRRSPGALQARVEAVVPRRSRLARKVAGARSEEQVVAANLDVVFIVMGLDADFNLRRLERFLVMVHDGGAEPVVVLTKADLEPEAPERRAAAAAAAPQTPVLVTAALRGDTEELAPWLLPGRTGALVGSSGAGKTTLIDRLLGGAGLPTAEVRRRDGRGRHTTTARELFVLPGGALLIDNPGVREVQPWSGHGVAEVYAEITELAAGCRFRDCRHAGEPGCAVEAAVAAGRLPRERLESLRRLEEEVAALARRHDERQRRAEERRQGRSYAEILAAKRRQRGEP